MSAPDVTSLDDIPSFGDPEHEATVDREHEARVRDKLVEADAKLKTLSVDTAWANYEAAQANVRADKARRIPIETDQPGSTTASSVAIEDMAKGNPKITTKVYAGAPLTNADIDAALDAHGYAHRQAAALAMKGWELTVEQLQARDV